MTCSQNVNILMTQYSFQLKLEGMQDAQQGFGYSLDLNPSQEDDPDEIFNPEIQESMRQSLQRQTSCRINPANLKRMIDTWKADIREGYRNSTLILSLPSAISEQINNLNEQGNQTIPSLVSPDLSTIEPQGGKLPLLNFS